jgi:hypothetical protein
MSFPYTSEFIDQGLSYATYRSVINNMLSRPPADEAAEKMRPYIQNNTRFMEEFDASVKLSENLVAALNNAPFTTWILLTEGWCGDAAFCVPVIAALEKAFPKKIRLRLFLRDSNPELMDAHLTNGGRSIPKLVVLNQELKEIAVWGPRPVGLQTLMNDWKNKGILLKEIIPKVHEWYYTDDTKSTQEELANMIKSYL